MAVVSPLRYPGGKGRLSFFIQYIILKNNLYGGSYVEQYVGGGGIACDLLLSGVVSHIIINDIDKAIWAFWDSIINAPDALCKLIKDTPVSVDEWQRQKMIQNSLTATTLELGFSTFFLNRTNVSGVLKGGIIGGLSQQGNYPITARFNKNELIKRISAIAEKRTSITLHCLDAIDLLNTIKGTINAHSLIYFDPPYYVKGKGLYRNFYTDKDHANIASSIKKLRTPWICSYDNVPEIRKLYKRIQKYVYDINYSAKSHCFGKEVIFFSRNLTIPDIKSPLEIKACNVRKLKKSLDCTIENIK